MLLNSTFLLAIDAAFFRMNVLVNGVIVCLTLLHIFDSLVVDESFASWAWLHSEYQLTRLICEHHFFLILFTLFSELDGSARSDMNFE